MKKQETLTYSYQIELSPGPTLKPEWIRFQKENHLTNRPDNHLKYISDLLVGMTYSHLHEFSTPTKPNEDSSWKKNLHQSLNPIFHLYKKSSARLKDLTSSFVPSPTHPTPNAIQEFENNFSTKIITFFSQDQVSLSKMTGLIEDLNQLESNLKKPLLFNFSIQFSDKFVDLLLTFQTFLFQLRSLVTINYNNFIDDLSQEGLLMDPLGDYLPQPEFIVNDAVIYWNFKKLARPYSTQTQVMKPEVPGSVNRLLIEPTEFLFKKYNHNAYYLIQNIPNGVLNSLTPNGLEETLYLITMDWLLGSPASLLFKIREELFGVKNSYEQIFWSDREIVNNYKAHKLIVQCSLDSNHIQFMAA
ncbi:MAG TPA: hypothetical protein PLJ21_06600 [Pseudobdellovibrionaceae bacterium]|nr:hypothetical protein [Pseudobdellovibrionaceae bacterium]